MVSKNVVITYFPTDIDKQSLVILMIYMSEQHNKEFICLISTKDNTGTN